MKQIFTHLFLLLCISSSALASVKITMTDSWDEINQHIKDQASIKDSLLIFDVDKTLIHFTKDCKEKTFFKQAFNCATEPTEEAVPQYVKAFQNQGFPTLAVTARNQLFKEVTAEQLHGNSYSFLKAPFTTELNYVFTKENSPNYKISAKSPVHLQDGLVLSGWLSKAEIMKMVLEHAELSYPRVFFVDDNSKNSVDMIKAFKNDPSIEMNVFYYYRHISAKKRAKGFKDIKKALKDF